MPISEIFKQRYRCFVAPVDFKFLPQPSDLAFPNGNYSSNSNYNDEMGGLSVLSELLGLVPADKSYFVPKSLGVDFRVVSFASGLIFGKGEGSP